MLTKVLIAKSRKKRQLLVKIWQEEIQKLQMIIDLNKTEYIVITQKKEHIENVLVNGQTLEQVSDFQYLGNIITDNGDKWIKISIIKLKYLQ